MNEDEFKKIRERLNQNPCPFQKAILSSRCGCEKCHRLNIAERENVACISTSAQRRCVELFDHFYKNARFVLKNINLEGKLPHGKAMKVQCGGLFGLAATFAEGAELPQVDNIDALVTKSLEKYGNMEEMPYQNIVKFISSCKVRHSQC